ncbi:peptidoglycan-binding protein [Mastigocoleus sp. MO_188.B34]|uniref:peptidoglycan-binding domain-containing protein n=1 Tax=Mastigocoleus sp. MO_188.B34 TaxID=3036635 RepID=UPI002630364C|nr:peptidoglycan-binding protein [Mastigocoleus sp. MO_188.B34]MDJ0695261.1 peptidoglycan-binding protein [Mastigocoleus sp. MO_188.B34]
MENISYFYAVSAYEAPEDIELIPLKINFQLFSGLNWKKLSSKTAMGFLTVALSLSVLSAAGQAMAAEKVGSKGTEVVAIQRCLKDLGYLKSKADGYFGPITKKAVSSYQANNNLVVDGIVGTRTAQKLKSDCSSSSKSTSITTSLLKQGSRGSAVTKLQDNLRSLSFYNNKSTGYYGPITKNAVIKFQKSQGLKADGIVGSNTQTKIQASLKPKGKDKETSYSSILRVGSKGSQVTSLQQRLKELGYFKGNTTKYFGQITKKAVIDFQRVKGLTADGIVGPKTWSALEKSKIGVPEDDNYPVLRRGDSGPKVRKLQKLLKIKVDGLFGPGTEAEVRRFQRDNALKADGIVGLKTWNALKGIKYPEIEDRFCINRPTISYGAKGEHVTYLQKRLRDWGYFSSNSTGYFGSKTEAAVRRFQQAKELYPDGVVSKRTWEALGNPGCANTKLHTVVVPLTVPEILERVRSFAPNATVHNSRLGKYVSAGKFKNYYRAKQLKDRLRNNGLDARVVYM